MINILTYGVYTPCDVAGVAPVLCKSLVHDVSVREVANTLRCIGLAL